MDYPEFDAERRRITRAWGREITDPELLAAAVADLREQAATIPDRAAQNKAQRYLELLDDFVAETRWPESETVRQAGEVLLATSRPDGTADEIRSRTEAAMAEITRIADAAPTLAERDAALEMNETLAETLEVLDAATPQEDTGHGSALDARTAGFANDPSLTPPARIAAPTAAPTDRPGTKASPKDPGRGL
ncbi:MAG TPA: hypothetical protein VGL05_22090 [Kribbella sp.]